MIEKVISGGQSGADIGGLLFAESRGLATGGWMPHGWETEDGPKPEYGERFGMEEHPMLGYAIRTEANARDSDATVRFATNFKSPGEICTLKAIHKFNKHWFDVDITDPPNPKEFAAWLQQRHVKVLNVAGNRETTAPGIREFVVAYMNEVLDELKRLEIERLEQDIKTIQEL